MPLSSVVALEYQAELESKVERMEEGEP